MSKVAQRIAEINNCNRKVLSIFLTAGFPEKSKTIELASLIYDNGADIIELGMPFSDPLADGPVIQKASFQALQNGVTMKYIMDTARTIKDKYPSKSLLLMGYANPILSYGIKKFYADCLEAGVDGLIVPDIPLEEFDSFYGDVFKDLDKILLTTPVSSESRILEIDQKSGGFVYCVSILGTTGARDIFDETTLINLQRTRDILKKNKMMIGFGISNAASVKKFSPYCDGVIVGSAVIKSIEADYNNQNMNWDETVKLIKELFEATK